MTDSGSEAGPDRNGPAREQVVIKDKRKIDSSGRPKNPAGPAEEARADAADQPAASAAEETPEATMGQPGKTVPGSTTAPAPKDSEAGEATAQEQAPQAQAGNLDEAGSTAAAEVIVGEVERPDGAKGPLGAELEALRTDLDERLRDLQRVTAEYANYRKRVERDRGVMAEQTVGAVISALLPILDDLDRARDHGDLVGPFGAVAEQLSGALAKFGLTGFGEPGDPFDPTRHEAVAHKTSADVTEPTCVAVMRRGYLVGERLLRAAMVAVADPE